MAKQGMKRPEPERKKNEVPPVPRADGKVWDGAPLESNDLAVENLMDGFDMTAADRQDLER